MSSNKKLIIDKVIQRLLTIEAINPMSDGCELPVFKNPFREVDEKEEVPCLKVALMRGDMQEYNNAIEFKRTDTLVIAYTDRGNDGNYDEENNLEDRLYEIEETIFDFIVKDHNNPSDPDSLYNLRRDPADRQTIINEIMPTKWDLDLQNGTAGIGTIVLMFDLEYYTKHEPDFDDLTGIDVEITPADATEDTDPIATLEIDLPSE